MASAEGKPTDDATITAIQQQPTEGSQQKELAQFFTPADVALYSAWCLLQHFADTDVVFDPSVGKGSLLIAAGVVLATEYGYRDRQLLAHLTGSEIDPATRDEAVRNVVRGLAPWLQGCPEADAVEIVDHQLKASDFFDCLVPDHAFVIANPPYKEEAGRNAWLPFAERLASEPGVAALSLIVPVSIASAKRCAPIRSHLLERFSSIRALHHEIRPRPLFRGIEQRISIVTATKRVASDGYRTTGFLTHRAGQRASVWTAPYVALTFSQCRRVFPKVSPEDSGFFYQQTTGRPLASELGLATDLWVRTTGRYHLVAQKERPETVTTKWRLLTVSERVAEEIERAFATGDALRWWRMFGDGRDLSLSAFLSEYRVPEREGLAEAA